MVRSKENAYHMGNNQSHKADDARRIDRKAHQQGRRQEIDNPPAVKIGSQSDGGLVPQQHQVQGAVLGPEKERPEYRHRQHPEIGVPACGGQAAHGPADHRLQRAAAGIDDVQEKV